MSQIIEATAQDYEGLPAYEGILPTHAHLQYSLGIYFSRKNSTKALKHFKKCTKLQPQNIDCLLRIADIYYYQNEYKSAHEFYKKITKYRSLSEDELRMASWAAQKAEKYAEAIAHYDLLLQIQPNATNLLINQGFCYGKLHQSEKSLECSLKAYSLNPHDYIALLNIGFRYWALQDLKQARSFTEKSLRASQDYSFALMNMGHICWCEGNLEEAKNYYARSRKVMRKDQEFAKLMRDDARYIVPYGIKMEDFEEVLAEILAD